MTPITQTKFYSKEEGTRGNCMQAAVASLLDLPLAGVPNFIEMEEPWQAFVEYWKGRGYYVLTLGSNFRPQCRYLAVGKSPRGVSHMVVYEKGALLHDPHPSRAGIVLEEIHLLVPLDPAGMLRDKCYERQSS